MTRILSLVFAIAFITGSPMFGQFTVPDAAFTARLNVLVPSAMNGNVLNTSDPSVLGLTYMNVAGAGIYDLDGIQYFTGLQELVCNGNYLATLPALPDAILRLECQSNDLVSITSLPASLTHLQCWDNQLTNLPALPASLEWLVCYNNQLTALPSLPNSITEIACMDNALNGLPALPASLGRLLCGNNPLLGTMPALPAGLTELSCGNNGLSALPALPAGLIQLNCDNNVLTALPTLPTSLVDLNCDLNLLTVLPALPAALENLKCTQNQLTVLPALPASLRHLICYNNSLTGLPTLPNGLSVLECLNNPIGVLPTLPDSLTILYAANNDLVSLPDLPATLFDLWCFGNQLTALPALPSTLLLLNCGQNLITELPELPGGLQFLLCGSNPIVCLPVLPNSVVSVVCSNTGVSCLPNIPVAFSDVSSDLGFPLTVCNVLSPCPLGGEAITGSVFNDANGNGVKDSGETGFTNAVIEAQPGSYLTAPDAAGDYVLPIDVGTFVVDGQDVLYHARTTAPASITLIASQIDPLNDIGYQAIPGVYDLVVDIAVMPARPGFDNNVYISVENIGTESTLAALDFTFDNTQTWVSSGIVPNTQVGNNATWSPTIAPGGVWGIAVTLNTDAGIAIGTPLLHTFSATPALQDTTPADNTITWNGIVVGAVDPNDKQVAPDAMTPAQIQAGGKLEYTIRFQNTGTFPASRVIITDTLSADLLWNTMELVSTSHTTEWYIHQGVLHFIMDPINLPDSTSDEVNSHGYVKFLMTPVSTLLNGATIENVANIYFDFNEPVITEAAIFTVDQSVGVVENAVPGFRLFPSPASEQLTIQLDTPDAFLEVRATDGRLLKAQRMIGTQVVLAISDLDNGLYVISVEEASGKKVSRSFVKQ